MTDMFSVTIYVHICLKLKQFCLHLSPAFVEYSYGIK